jgi:hypothetical protein
MGTLCEDLRVFLRTSRVQLSKYLLARKYEQKF